MALITSRLNKLQKLLNLGQNYKKTICTSSASRKIFQIQDERDFKERVLESEKPVVIDFQAKWCGPCKLLEPRLESIIGSKNDKVNLAKVDIDQLPDIAMEFDVQAVPHVIGYKNGDKHSSFIGLKDEDEIESFVEKLIGN